MPTLPTPERLADEFCRVLNDWLDAEALAEVNRRNALAEYEGLCATHDFCDPNQAMIDALQIFGLDFEQEYIPLINNAWDLAKARQFAMTKPTIRDDAAPVG